MFCIICEAHLDNSRFSSSNANICEVCTAKLHKMYSVNFLPSRKVSKITACLSLIVAVRLQAILDGELADFESYWLQSLSWSRLWCIIKEEQSKNIKLEAMEV